MDKSVEQSSAPAAESKAGEDHGKAAADHGKAGSAEYGSAAVVHRVPEMETIPNKQEPISIPASSFTTKSLSGSRIFHLAKHNLSFERPQSFNLRFCQHHRRCDPDRGTQCGPGGKCRQGAGCYGSAQKSKTYSPETNQLLQSAELQTVN